MKLHAKRALISAALAGAVATSTSLTVFQAIAADNSAQSNQVYSSGGACLEHHQETRFLLKGRASLVITSDVSGNIVRAWYADVNGLIDAPDGTYDLINGGYAVISAGQVTFIGNYQDSSVFVRDGSPGGPTWVEYIQHSQTHPYINSTNRVLLAGNYPIYLQKNLAGNLVAVLCFDNCFPIPAGAYPLADPGGTLVVGNNGVVESLSGIDAILCNF